MRLQSDTATLCPACDKVLDVHFYQGAYSVCKYSKRPIRDPKAYEKAERKKQKKFERNLVMVKGRIVAIIRDKFDNALRAYDRKVVISLLAQWGAGDGVARKEVDGVISAALERLKGEGLCWSEDGAVGEVIFYTHPAVVEAAREEVLLEVSPEEERELLIEKYEEIAAHRSRFHPLLRKSGAIAA